MQLAKPEKDLMKSPSPQVPSDAPKSNPDAGWQSAFDNESDDKENQSSDANLLDWAIGPKPTTDQNNPESVVPAEDVGLKPAALVEDSSHTADSEPNPQDTPEQYSGPAEEESKNNSEPPEDEWDQLSKVPYERRRKFLREVTTVPTDQVGDSIPLSLETKKHRLQMLLAEHKFGIPSLALADEYEKMFGHKLDVQEWGYEMLSSLIAEMSDVITVQEPDEISCLYHPKYPNDRILLDKRYGHQFTSQPPIGMNRNTSTSGIGSGCESESEFDALISRARINHDCDFPEDVVLPGEQYTEPMLIKTAQVEGTRGVYSCLITGAANPHHFYLNVKNDYTETIETLTGQVKEYFREEDYRVPEEFIYPGFACLRQRDTGAWERVSITGRSLTDNKILVESVDFGGTDAVSRSHLRLMPRKFLSAPRQAIVVSLFGIKPPEGAKKFTYCSALKLAGWSYEYYWMDCLFIDPKPVASSPEEGTADDKDSATGEQQHCLETGSSVSPTHREDPQKMSLTKRIWYRKPQYDVIILDRMLPTYDVFINDLLVIQMLASYVLEYKEELERLEGELKRAIKDIPCQENPMEKSFREQGYI